MEVQPVSRIGLAVAGIATGVLALAGVSLWLAAGVLLMWIGSLWAARPVPGLEPSREGRLTVSRETIAPFIEPLGVPLLLLDGERIVAANAAARATLGAHILGQDARVALRHPDAIALLNNDKQASATVSGLTTPRSIWQLSRFRIDKRFRLIEFVNRTAEADISRAHTDFVANASHELRTPLASIIGYLETLSDPATKVNAATRGKFVVTMENEAKRMQALVDDLMSLSRIEAEKHDAPQQEIALGPLVEGVARDVASLHGPGRVVVESLTDETTIHGDRAQLDQLVRNLIDNAIKYGDADAPVTVTLSGGAEEALLLSVADKGPGIEADHLPHLTRRFYRTDPGRSRASGGTGLGLAIVKHIVERHGGRLDISSKVGIGTTVSVTFPRA